MARVTKEQIEKAKQIDLLTYLQTCEPNAIKKSGRNEFYLIAHDSLKISNGRWHWFSRGIGGKTALDFLIHVYGMGFVDAVQTLLDSRAAPIAFHQPISKKESDCRPFLLPPRHIDNFRAIAYLQSRGIDSEIIDYCIKIGALYESAKYHNVVFVGRDVIGKAHFACMRSTAGRFMQDVDGSDKRYNFAIPSKDELSRIVFVFESGVDALSHATFDKKSEIGSDWNCFHRLSLGGISPLALVQYLKDHPQIDTINLCLDNDMAGQKANKKIREFIINTNTPHNGRYKMEDILPSAGKDFNDALQGLIKEEKESAKTNRTPVSAAFSR